MLEVSLPVNGEGLGPRSAMHFTAPLRASTGRAPCALLRGCIVRLAARSAVRGGHRSATAPAVMNSLCSVQARPGACPRAPRRLLWGSEHAHCATPWLGHPHGPSPSASPPRPLSAPLCSLYRRPAAGGAAADRRPPRSSLCSEVHARGGRAGGGRRPADLARRVAIAAGACLLLLHDLWRFQAWLTCICHACAAPQHPQAPPCPLACQPPPPPTPPRPACPPRRRPCSARYRGHGTDLAEVPEYARHSNDSGSPEVQIARMSARVQQLTTHLEQHKKDFSTRRGLLAILAQRKQMLLYLQVGGCGGGRRQRGRWGGSAGVGTRAAALEVRCRRHGKGAGQLLPSPALARATHLVACNSLWRGLAEARSPAKLGPTLD